MRVEFSESCQHCDRRPTSEIAGQKFKRLEEAATKLGYTVTDGSVTCEGKEPGPASFESLPSCGVKFRTPVLASIEERAQVDGLAELDGRLKNIIPATQALISELELESGPL